MQLAVTFVFCHFKNKVRNVGGKKRERRTDRSFPKVEGIFHLALAGISWVFTSPICAVSNCGTTQAAVWWDASGEGPLPLSIPEWLWAELSGPLSPCFPRPSWLCLQAVPLPYHTITCLYLCRASSEYGAQHPHERQLESRAAQARIQSCLGNSGFKGWRKQCPSSPGFTPINDCCRANRKCGCGC